MSRVVALALLVALGCSAPAKPGQRPPPNAAPRFEHVIARAFGASVKGRVLLDGVAPVPFFGVIVTNSLSLETLVSSDVTTIRSVDGTFDIPVPHGKWNIIIVGPGFGVAVLRDRQVILGRSVALGDIHVDRAATIRGRITNASGAPVAGARVRIHGGSFNEWFAQNTNGVLKQLLLGTYETVSGPSGEYAIDGVKRVDTEPGPLRVRAFRGGEKSPEKVFSEGDHTFDLAIGPTGMIEGNVIDMKPAAVIARHASDRDMVTFAKVNPDRTFRFDDLTAGDYDLSVIAGGVPMDRALARVTVIGGGSVSVRLSNP